MSFVKKDLEWDEARATLFVTTFSKLRKRTNAEYIPAFSAFLATIVPSDPTPEVSKEWCDKWIPDIVLHWNLLEHDPAWIQKLLPIYRHWEEDKISGWLSDATGKTWWPVELSQELCVLPTFRNDYKATLVSAVLDLDMSDAERMFKKDPPEKTAQLFRWWVNDLNVSQGLVGQLLAFCLRSHEPHLMDVVKKALTVFGTPSPWEGLHVLSTDDLLPKLSTPDHMEWIRTWEQVFGKTPALHQDMLITSLFFEARMVHSTTMRVKNNNGVMPAEDQWVLDQLTTIIQDWYPERHRRQQMLSTVASKVTDFHLIHVLAPILDAEDLQYLADNGLHRNLRHHPVLERAILMEHMPRDKPSALSRKM